MAINVNSYGQKDSTWSKYLTVSVSNDKTPNNISTYTTKSAALLIQKGNHTIAPEVVQRSIYNLVGYQYGLSYYKKFNWGYSHADIHYSNSPILPHVSIRTNLFYLLRKGIVLNGGLHRFSYKNGVKASIVSAGASLYYKSTMTTCTMKMSNLGNPQYISTIRKYSKNDIDYFQVSISNANEQGQIIGDINSSFNLYSYQFGAVKTIAKKLQIQVSFGLSNVKQSESNSKFFNYSIGLKRKL